MRLTVMLGMPLMHLSVQVSQYDIANTGLRACQCFSCLVSLLDSSLAAANLKTGLAACFGPQSDSAAGKKAILVAEPYMRFLLSMLQRAMLT